jgi:hypothetical protein
MGVEDVEVQLENAHIDLEAPLPGKSTVTMERTIANSIWNVGALFVSLVVTFFTAPLILAILGTSNYGLFALLTAILAPLGLTNLNLGQATVKYVVEAYGRGDVAEAGTYAAVLSVDILSPIYASRVARTCAPWTLSRKTSGTNVSVMSIICWTLSIF